MIMKVHKIRVEEGGGRGYNKYIQKEKAGDFVEKIMTKREETLKAIETLCLFDDDLMTLVFDKNISATELLLNIILQRNDMKVTEVVAQREYKNPMAGGRSITIDIYAVDGEHKVYDIEVQCAASGADVHRARFHSSMIDTKMLKEKQKFKELQDSYVIFITKTDVVGAGLALYHIERKYEEIGEAFGDGSHIIYVNGSYKDDKDPVGKLMHDFRCTSSEDMFYRELAKQVEYFKETEGGREIMCKAFEDLADKRAEERAKELALKLLARGKMTVEEIAEDTELSLEVVKQLSELQPV